MEASAIDRLGVRGRLNLSERDCFIRREGVPKRDAFFEAAGVVDHVTDAESLHRWRLSALLNVHVTLPNAWRMRRARMHAPATLVSMGRKSQRKADERGVLDRCRYCGNDRPGTLKPLSLPPHFPVCRDFDACLARRKGGARGLTSLG
jgi:hypothetical protein